MRDDARADITESPLVLVVEDEASVRSFCCAVLRRFGYRVVEAANPIAALDTLDRLPEPVGLVLTDITMPGMNGKEMVKRIDRRQQPDLRVLYMSGYIENMEPGLDLAREAVPRSADLLKARTGAGGRETARPSGASRRVPVRAPASPERSTRTTARAVVVASPPRSGIALDTWNPVRSGDDQLVRQHRLTSLAAHALLTFGKQPSHMT